LTALKNAYEELGRSPTIEDYRNLDLSPSSPSTIVEKFGSWNEAKKEAGLRCHEQNNQIGVKPKEVELPDDKSWENISSYQRYYYKNREKEKERTSQRTEKLKKWYREYKQNFACEYCGEDHPACIDFHHTGEKEISVSNLVTRKNTSKKRIKNEIRKCKVLCANCHRKLHYEEEKT
jgi:hypothetical protein